MQEKINPHGHCRLHDALWLFRHLMGERLGLRGDGCTYLRNQPCAIRIAHFREEKQKRKGVSFRKKDATYERLVSGVLQLLVLVISSQTD
jgi:hypothetical protein